MVLSSDARDGYNWLVKNHRKSEYLIYLSEKSFLE